MKTLPSFFAVLIMAALPPAAAAQEYTTTPVPAPPLSTSQWTDDLDTLAANIPRLHGNAFHAVAKSQFDASVLDLRSHIGSMNEDEILTGFARIIGMLQDGHNYIDMTRGTGRTRNYPLRAEKFDDGIYIERAAPEASRLVGGKLISIDGHLADSVLQEILPLIPHDPGNLGFAFSRLSEYMLNAMFLHGLGVTASGDRATFVVERDGRTEVMTLHPDSFERRWFYGPPPSDWADARDRTREPALWRLHRDSTFWLTYLHRGGVLYAQVNAVSNGTSESLAEFSTRLAGAVRSNHADRLILDLRWNDGGNNYLLKPLIVNILQMPEIDRRGHFFVFTGPRTFSAAQNLVNRLENFTEAIFVGGPTGENVNFYGDTKRFVLTNSRCRVSVANLWWQDKDPRDRRTATFPEIAVEESYHDYIQSTDPALEYVIRNREIPTVEDAVLLGLKGDGQHGAREAFRNYRNDPAHRYLEGATVEGRINNLGYMLLGKKRLDDAITVFKINTEEFPGSFNAWDSLGEGLAAAGRKADAIAAYMESLRLNPASTTGLEALAKLKK